MSVVQFIPSLIPSAQTVYQTQVVYQTQTVHESQMIFPVDKSTMQRWITLWLIIADCDLPWLTMLVRGLTETCRACLLPAVTDRIKLTESYQSPPPSCGTTVAAPSSYPADSNMITLIQQTSLVCDVFAAVRIILRTDAALITTLITMTTTLLQIAPGHLQRHLLIALQLIQ